jgi:uncharacterized membrane protein
MKFFLALVGIILTSVICYIISIVGTYFTLTHGYDAQVQSWPVIIGVSFVSFFLTVMIQACWKIAEKMLSEE